MSSNPSENPLADLEIIPTSPDLLAYRKMVNRYIQGMQDTYYKSQLLLLLYRLDLSDFSSISHFKNRTYR